MTTPEARDRRKARRLSVPELAGPSLGQAALAYADTGWYLLPTHPADIKNPGSVVGGNWHEKSTRDAEQIRRWWTENPEYGIALHCGRSGALVFDLDADDLAGVPGQFAEALRGADATQITRLTGHRGHYVFAMPPGESLSNRAGAFATFGEVRGKNGVIIAAPTPHPDGGDYHWTKTGVITTPPPDTLRQCLSDASVADVLPLTNAQLEDFLDKHTRDDMPHLMRVPLEVFKADVAAGMSRHYAMVRALGMGYRDAIAGLYPARRYTDELGTAFRAAYVTRIAGRRSAPSPSEFWDAARYVAAEEANADPEELRARKDGFTDVETYRQARKALDVGGHWHVDTVRVWAGWAADDGAGDRGPRGSLTMASGSLGCSRMWSR